MNQEDILAYLQIHAGYECRLITRKKGTCICNICGHAWTAQRHRRDESSAVLLRSRLPKEQMCPVSDDLQSELFFQRLTCPVKRITYIPVIPITGQIQLNRMLSGPYSTAIVFEALHTAALEALYHVRRGLGRSAAVEEIWIKHPGRLFSRK